NTMASSSVPDASRHHTLTNLITSSNPTQPGAQRTLYPNDETLTNLLASRSRLEIPYTRVGSSGSDFIVINPLRMLGCMGEETRKGYQKDVEGTERRIKVARNDFNESVATYNQSVRAFPGSLAAKIFGFRAKEGFAAVSGAENPVEIKF
ncbi:MAG: hypothetical protein EOO05_21385, partial [Chitinophagaceae bacterium]